MAVKRLINRVSVDAAFFKKLSPMENLLFAARLYGLDGADRQARRARDPGPARHREKRVGRPVEQMSRGHAAEGRDRASPADQPDAPAPRRADHRPRPALASSTSRRSSRRSATTHDATIVLTTHDLAEAERLCGRITVLNDGRIVAEGTPDGLKAMTADRLGRPATLEDVFMTYTGRSLDDDVDEDDAEPDDE